MCKDAILCYKWKAVKWYVLVLLLFAFGSSLLLIFEPDWILGVSAGIGAEIEEAPFHCNTIGKLQIPFSIFTWVIAAILGFAGMEEYSHADRKEFLHSLPYKKSRIWLRLYMTGLVSIVTAYVLLMLASMISFELHWERYHEAYLLSGAYPLLCNADSMAVGLWIIFGDLILCLFVYHLAVFMRMAMNRFFAALAGFVGVLVFPYMVFDNIGEYIMQHFRYADTTWFYQMRIKTSIFEQVYLRKEELHFMKYQMTGSTLQEICLPYSSFDGTVLLGWCLAVLLLGALSRLLSKKDISAGKLCKTLWLENIFLVSGGVYLVLFLPMLRFFKVLSVATMCISMGILFLLVEIVLIRIYKGKGHYDRYNTFKEGRGYHA